ncbi:MAG: beta-galactosidase [Cytophagales bacterium]|nr:beta-galactosidase [Cytophagales bacterium]
MTLIRSIILPTFLFKLAVLFPSCDKPEEKAVEIRGIYGHPKPYWDREIKLSELGVNSIFVHSSAINDKMMQQAGSDGLKVFAEFPTLNGKNYVSDHPEAWAIDETGEQVEAASWFMGVCPNDPGFRQYRFEQLRNLLERYDLDGIWMDYVHWHAQFEDPEPILPETCFCDRCLSAFSAFSEIDLPQGSTSGKATWILKNANNSWRTWRCRVIYDWTAAFRSIIKKHDPELLLGLYHCPWNDAEFDSARMRILGLDYELLKQTIDVFSPMVYHGRMGREPEWVQENISWFSNKLGIQQGVFPKVWPIVQAYDDPELISGEEFELVLRGGLSGKSSGVMMFTTNAMAQSDEKTGVMRRLYVDLSK